MGGCGHRHQDEAAERGVEERATSVLVRENGICPALEAGSSWVASRNPGEASVVETSEQVRASGHAREEQQFPLEPVLSAWGQQNCHS